MWALWSAFTEQFGGIDQFLESDPNVRAAYLEQLDRSARRLASYRNSPKRHYFAAVAAVHAYLSGWLSPPSTLRIELARRVADGFEQGRMQQSVGP